MSRSFTKTNRIRERIGTEFFTKDNWIAQDANGHIYLYTGKPVLIEPFKFWASGVNSYCVISLGDTIKTMHIKTYRQACAQLTVDNWYLDRYGRLIVEDRNTPNLLKEQA